MTAALVPEVKDIPAWPELIREYATRLSVPASGIRSEEELAAIAQQNAALQQAQQY